jgi:hypothetical protein
MKAPVIALIIALPAAGIILYQYSALQSLRVHHAETDQEVAQLKMKLEAAEAEPKFDPAEVARLRQDNAELIKLRGELNNLRNEASAARKEKEDVAKKLSAAEARAESARQASAQAAPQPFQNAVAPNALAAQSAAFMQKVRSGQPLSEAELTNLALIRGQVAELEKSPAQFSQYQAAYLGTLLGWNNDPRTADLERMFSGAVKAAQSRGLTFNAPGQTPDTWTEAQHQLNNRVANGVGNLLNEQEKAILNNGVGAIMSADVPLPRTK